MQYIIVMQDIYCIISKAVFLLENSKNERMKQARIDAGLSQQQLADAVGATRQTIGLIEQAATTPVSSSALPSAKRSVKHLTIYLGIGEDHELDKTIQPDHGTKRRTT